MSTNKTKKNSGSASLAGRAGKYLAIGSVPSFILGVAVGEWVGTFLALSAAIALLGGFVLLLVGALERRIEGEDWTTGTQKFLVLLAMPVIFLAAMFFAPSGMASRPWPDPAEREQSPPAASTARSSNSGSGAEIVHTITCRRVMLLDKPTGMMTCRGAIANVSGRTLQDVFIRLDYDGVVSGWNHQAADLQPGAVTEVNILDNWHRGQPDVAAKESGVGVFGRERELETLMGVGYSLGGGEIPAAYHRLLEDIRSRGR